MNTPKAMSVTAAGEPDGFEPVAAFFAEHDPGAGTRVVASVPLAFLARVHADLIRALEPPLSVLYRQRVDRRLKNPQLPKPRDFLAIDFETEVVLAAFQECADLVYHDARGEFWVRGRRGEQVVLDCDGVLYAYPDDPLFRDVLRANGLPEQRVPTMAERDYAKHWYHAENDALEAALIDGLGLSEL